MDITQNIVPIKTVILKDFNMKAKKQKHYRHKCFNCKKNKWCLWTEDPYASEILGDDKKHWLCTKCIDNANDSL